MGINILYENINLAAETADRVDYQKGTIQNFEVGRLDVSRMLTARPYHVKMLPRGGLINSSAS